MNFDFSEDQLAIRDAVEAIGADFGADYWLVRDRDGRWPSEFCDAVAGGGWFGVTMPKEHGGAGLGIAAAAMVMRTIGKLGSAAVSSVHLNLFGPQPVVVFGTEAQKRRMLPPLIDGSDREVFVNRVGGGPDGLHIDEHDNLWVACNQSNEVLVLEPTRGRVIAKIGDFAGIDRNGAPKGFLWPNTFAFHGDDILVTNLSLDLGTAIGQLADELGLAHLKTMNLKTIDGPWAHQVKVHTVSKIKKRIPEGQ
ncbi:MAG TPA: acyl-CoA dehydrogenase family protein [Burkholderiaceae bacterium]|nr:acyl-CoA dehydrogenase family protein [Burkholderiaceae bacterium]